MTQPRRIAFIGNSLPRRCGIATFTTDLQQAVASARPEIETCIVAMNDHGQVYDYPSSFSDQRRHTRRLYAGGRLPNRGQFEVVCLQHDSHLGGESGDRSWLLSRLTFHRHHASLRSADPTAVERNVISRIAEVRGASSPRRKAKEPCWRCIAPG